MIAMIISYIRLRKNDTEQMNINKMLESKSPCIRTNLYNSKMKVIYYFFIGFFTAVCNASVQPLQNESFYVVAIVTRDTVNCEYTVPNSKYEHSLYLHLLG
jgi:hypothetical protein